MHGGRIYWDFLYIGARLVSLRTTKTKRERPIIFSTPMIRAILDHRKTQTRRVIVAPRGWQMVPRDPFNGVYLRKLAVGGQVDDERYLCCPYGSPGDHLWVREKRGFLHEDFGYDRIGVYYEADNIAANELTRIRWRPSINMPRWASRIDLEITALRVERLQEINQADAYAEGFDPCEPGQLTSATDGCVHAYRLYWNSLNAKRGYAWETNPWVWVIEFKRIKP